MYRFPCTHIRRGEKTPTNHVPYALNTETAGLNPKRELFFETKTTHIYRLLRMITVLTMCHLVRHWGLTCLWSCHSTESLSCNVKRKALEGLTREGPLNVPRPLTGPRTVIQNKVRLHYTNVLFVKYTVDFILTNRTPNRNGQRRGRVLMTI